MAWVRYTTGRLKSDYHYSVHLVYNNFPWPENPSDKQKQAIETAAQAVLDARAQFPDSSLADLYDPLTTPPVLLKAYQTPDKVVDTAYGKTNFKTEAERVAFLFELYQKYTTLFPVVEAKKGNKAKITSTQAYQSKEYYQLTYESQYVPLRISTEAHGRIRLLGHEQDIPVALPVVTSLFEEVIMICLDQYSGPHRGSLLSEINSIHQHFLFILHPR
jgi:hypothetical protein